MKFYNTSSINCIACLSPQVKYPCKSWRSWTRIWDLPFLTNHQKATNKDLLLLKKKKKE